jgi:16S rRNA (uracil1498-N3)-methyltransferase
VRQLLCDLPLDLSAFVPSAAVSHRLRRVLRLAEGAELTLADGQGRQVQAVWQAGQLVPAPPTVRVTPPPPRGLVLAIGVLKGERMDWLVEKAAELGVTTLQPLQLSHCVVKIGADAAAKQARWQAMADAAFEQCGRSHQMLVVRPVVLATFLAQRPAGPLWVADEVPGTSALTGSALPGGSEPLTVLVGPEGGLHKAEREAAERNGGQALSLGPAVLRAETAALAGVVIADALIRRVF